MDERRIECDGVAWKVIMATRSSPHRLELVFESLEEPRTLLRGEAAAADLAELSDGELCFLIREQRA